MISLLLHLVAKILGKNFFLQLIIGIASIYLGWKFIPGVEFVGGIKALLIVGVILGLINFFIKPILDFITMPLKVLTFGLFGLVLNMGIIHVVDVLREELIISGIKPLFWMTIMIWGLSLATHLVFQKKGA